MLGGGIKLDSIKNYVEVWDYVEVWRTNTRSGVGMPWDYYDNVNLSEILGSGEVQIGLGEYTER